MTFSAWQSPRSCTGPCHRPSIFAREPRVCDKRTHVCPGTYTVGGVPRFLSKFSSARTKSSSREDEDQGQDPVPFDHLSTWNGKTIMTDKPSLVIDLRLGNILQRGTDWRPLVLMGDTVAYQPPGSVGSLSCSETQPSSQEYYKASLIHMSSLDL